MTSVGKMLRTEREAQGREIAEIAEDLCILQRYLRAIEEDDAESLPGFFFYKSFARQYASILGVEENRVLPGLEAMAATAEALPLPGVAPAPARPAEAGIGVSPLRPLDPIVEDGNRRYFPDRHMGVPLASLAVALLVCSGFYAWWNKAPQPVVSAAQSSVQAPVQAPIPVPMRIPPQAPVAASPVSTLAKPAETTPPEPSALNVTATTEPDGRLVLNLSATEETWLSITSGGKPIFTGTLQPSETKTLTGVEMAKMKVGNAGGLEVRWNGKPIGPIGPRGQVRVVLFTPENFEILNPGQTL